MYVGRPHFWSFIFLLEIGRRWHQLQTVLVKKRQCLLTTRANQARRLSPTEGPKASLSLFRSSYLLQEELGQKCKYDTL